MISAAIIVNDVESTVAFYTEKLGFTTDGSLPGPDGKPIFGNARLDEHAHIMFNRADSMNAANKPADGERLGAGVEFRIALPADYDIDGLYDRFQSNGANIIMPIQDSFWGERRFAIHDPNGYYLSFNKLTREVSEDEMAAESAKG